ncbi:MAG: hypothetical protein H8E59_00210 [Actinobacteria bacterium]|nr:hypothetical protein [Actinomycetota bacterium]
MSGDHQIRDNDGLHLDATFTVERSVEFDLILYSRGGGKPPSNPDYLPALRLLLERLATQGATIHDITIDSHYALRHYPQAADRRLDLLFPLSLKGSTDCQDLQRQISRAQGPVARRPDAVTGGNPTKRIRIRVSCPSATTEAAFLAIINPA